MAEIFLFLYYDNITRRISWVSLIRLSVFATFARWIILATCQDETVLLFSQILHAFSYGAFQLSAMKLAFQIAPPSLQDRAQGLLMSVGAGFGMGVGKIIGGYCTTLLAEGALLNTVFYGSACVSAVGFLLSCFIKDPRQCSEYATIG